MNFPYFDSSELIGILGGFFAVYSLIIIAVAVFSIVVTWKIFSRSGEKGWKSLIPVYNSYTETKLVWKPLWFWIMLAVQLVFWGLYVFIMVSSVGYDGGTVSIESLLAAFLVMFVIGIFIIVVVIIQNVYLSRSFDEEDGFAVGLIFLPIIFRAIIAFGRHDYVGNGYEISKANKEKKKAEAAAGSELPEENTGSWYQN